MTSVTTDPLAGKLIVSDSQGARTTVQIQGIDCGKTAFGTGWQGDNRMWIYCVNGSSCIQDEIKAADSDDWQPQGAARNSASYVTAGGDASSTEELAHAFSHVIYLLQQHFKELHGEGQMSPLSQ